MKKSTYQPLLLVSLVLLLSALQGCAFNPNAIKGDKNITTSEINVKPFDALHISGMFKVTLVEGNGGTIWISTDDNLQEYVVAEVRNNTLHLGMKSGNSYSPSQMEAVIPVDMLREINLSGATSLRSEHTLQSESFNLSISGAGDLNLALNTGKLTTRISGAGSVNISGNAQKHELSVSGVASVNCGKLITTDTKVSISGAGSAKVWASGNLDASVSGVGSIEYGGEPRKINTRKSGVGSINPV